MIGIHVVPHQGGWAIKTAGAKQVGKKFKTKAAAEKAGKVRAKRIRGELFVHDRQGKIQIRYSYGNDPPRRPG